MIDARDRPYSDHDGRPGALCAISAYSENQGTISTSISTIQKTVLSIAAWVMATCSSANHPFFAILNRILTPSSRDPKTKFS